MLLLKCMHKLYYQYVKMGIFYYVPFYWVIAVNALLSILMADMTSGLVGFLSSTVLIVIFGEIIPQASCSRHALLIGYYSLPVVKSFILLFYIMAYPMGYILDKVLGEDLGK